VLVAARLKIFILGCGAALEDTADAVAFLASEHAFWVTLTTQRVEGSSHRSQPF